MCSSGTITHPFSTAWAGNKTVQMPHQRAGVPRVEASLQCRSMERGMKSFLRTSTYKKCAPEQAAPWWWPKKYTHCATLFSTLGNLLRLVKYPRYYIPFTSPSVLSTTSPSTWHHTFGSKHHGQHASKVLICLLAQVKIKRGGRPAVSAPRIPVPTLLALHASFTEHTLSPKGRHTQSFCLLVGDS